METRHIPPLGEGFIGQHSTSEDCPCKPRRELVTKASSSGRGGSHQGYKVIAIKWHHNPLTNKIQEA